jgi:ABC-type transport system involved in cytochrome c biogenesis permease component
MSRYLARGFYGLVAVVVCPLVAWHLAVDATNRGFGARGFFVSLLGLPVVGALLSAMLLRRRARETTFGVVAAVLATFALVVIVVFVTLASR